MKAANYWQIKIILFLRGLLLFLSFTSESVHALESVISLVIATHQWQQIQKAPWQQIQKAPSIQNQTDPQRTLPEPFPQSTPPGKQVRYFLVPERPPIIHYNCIKNLTLHINDEVSTIYLPDKPLVPSPLFAEYEYLSLNNSTEKHYIIHEPYPPGNDPDPDHLTPEDTQNKMLEIPLADSDQSAEPYLIEFRKPKIRMILRFKHQRPFIYSVREETDALLRSLSLESDLIVDHYDDLMFYLPPQTDIPQLQMDQTYPSDTPAQLFYGMGLLVAIAEVEGETVYLLRWPDGSITSITASEYYRQLSIAFEAELDAFINGPLFPRIAPEVYRNGYALPQSTSGNSSYRDWCDANGFSKSDGNAYWRKRWSKNWQVLGSRAQPFHSAGISIEEVLKKIWMAPKRKKKGKNQNKASPPPSLEASPQNRDDSPPEAKPDNPSPRVVPIDTAKLPDFNKLAQSMEVSRVNHPELQAMSQVARHLWVIFFFLTGIDLPEANEEVSRETPARLGMKWLKNSASEMLPSDTFHDLFSFIEQLGIYSPGSGARIKPSGIVTALCNHFGNKTPRCTKLRRHINFFRLVIYQCPKILEGSAQATECLETAHWYLTQINFLESLMISTPLFDPHLKIVTDYLEMELDDNASPSRQLIDAVIHLIGLHDLYEYWPLLAYNLGLSANVLELFKSFETGVRKIQGEWHSVIHAVFKEALQLRDGFIDPLELSLVLRESGMGIVASILQLPDYPRDVSVSEMLIRFPPSDKARRLPIRSLFANITYRTPAELMLSGPFNHYQIGIAKVLLLQNVLNTYIDQLVAGHFPDTWRSVLNDAFFANPERSANLFNRFLYYPPSVSEEVDPAYSSRLPLGSRYMGTLIPSERQRRLLSEAMIFFSVVANALHTLQRIAEGQQANVILQGMWLESDTEASQLVIYSVPQSSPHTLDIRSNLKQLLLEWLLQSPISSAEASLLFSSALEANKQLDRDTPSTYLSTFISMFFQLETTKESQYAHKFAGLSRAFSEYEHQENEWYAEAVYPHRTYRKLIHQWLYPSSVTQLPAQSMLDQLSTEHFLILRFTHPDHLRTLLPGALPQYFMVHSNEQNLFHSLLPNAPIPLLQRSGPLMQDMSISVVSSQGGEPGAYYAHSSQHDGNYPSTVAFFNVKAGWKTLTTLLNDFKVWPLKNRVGYLLELIKLIQDNPSFQRPLHLQHLIAYDPELTAPGILLEPGMAQDFSPGAFSQLVLEVMTGQPLPESKYPQMAHSISFLEKNCLKLLPYYLRPILELMNMAHWLPSTTLSPSLTTQQLLPFLTRILENLHHNLQSVEFSSVSHFIEGSPSITPEALCTFPLHCHPDTLAVAGMSCNTQYLFCPHCQITFGHTRHVWEDLTLIHWLNAHQNCRKNNQVTPSVALQHIPDFLVLCSGKFDQNNWLKGSMTKQDLDWLAQQDTIPEKWLLLAWLTGSQPEHIAHAYQQHQNNLQNLLKALFSGKAISRTLMIQAAGQADMPLIHKLLTHNLVEPLLPPSTTMETQSLVYQYAQFLQQYPGLLDIQELEDRKKAQWQTADLPDWLPVVSAIQERHPATIPSLLHHSLESCRILAPDSEREDPAQTLIECIVHLANRHNLTKYWAITGYFLGLDSKTLGKASRRKDDNDRLKETLNSFLQQNGRLLDPRALGVIFSHSGLRLISRLLHFPIGSTQLESSLLLTSTLRTHINQRLRHKVEVLEWVPLNLVYPKIDRSLGNLYGIAEPALLIEALNQRLRNHVYSATEPFIHDTLTISGHPAYSGLLSHVPYDGEIQAWWGISLDQLPHDLPELIEQIENAVTDLQKVQPMPDNVSVHLETGTINQNIPYLQFVLYTSLQTDPDPAPLATELARGLLGGFSGHHLHHGQSMQIAQNMEWVTGLIRTHEILPASRYQFRQALARLIHQWHYQPPQQLMSQHYRQMVENVRENPHWLDTDMPLIVPIAIINKGKAKEKSVQCQHCNRVLKSPKKTECCETTLCLDCINIVIQDNAGTHCPYCESNVEQSHLPYTDQESEAEKANNILYQCREPGCSTSGTLTTLEQHSWSKHNLVPELNHNADDDLLSWNQKFLLQRVIRQLTAHQQLNLENPLLTTYDSDSSLAVQVTDPDQALKVTLVWQHSQGDIISEECSLSTSATYTLGARTRKIALHTCNAPQRPQHAEETETYLKRSKPLAVVQNSVHWPDTHRARYLIQLSALLQSLSRRGTYPDFNASQLVRFKNDKGVETAGILYHQTLPAKSALNTLTLGLSVLAGSEVFLAPSQVTAADMSLILSHHLLPEPIAAALLHFLKPMHDDSLGSIIAANPHPTLSLSPGTASSALYIPNHPNHPLVLTPLSLLQQVMGYGHQWYCTGCNEVHKAPLLNHCLVCPESSQNDKTDFCTSSVMNQMLHHPVNEADLELRRTSLLNSHRCINVNDLALAGFHYNQENRQVECPQCQLNITPYLGLVNPWHAHQALNPGCPYIRPFYLPQPLSYSVGQLIEFIKDCYKKQQPEIPAAVLQQLGQTVLKEMHSYLGDSANQLLKGRINAKQLCQAFAKASLEMAHDMICPICMDKISDVRLMPCGHAMCNGCLQKLLDNHNRAHPNDPVPCHKCRAPMEGIDNIR
ncbi:RING-HC finger protein [Endozoicomonas numazuensis]|uniref:RING-type domain-containing protein n=1 Tax=Endozoicomonas numazuensis TaxID=1137799 RepID=A0A081NDD4_9GAMM|nr:RING-HC finger protein [Endozoicomonas numazuensis]KEQ16457.1 hypothetical protein GZ78_21595 [Endozoicomonas numazuensis]